MAETHFGRFRHDSAGIREIFRGSGMQAAVGEAAQRKANQASQISSGHHVDHRPIGPGHYYSNVYVGRNTALGFVGPTDREGRLDQLIYHTLDSINH